MAWFILSQLFSTLVTLLRLDRTSETDKDLETLILRQVRFIKPSRRTDIFDLA
jgi:hypothetical protein